MDEKYWEIYKYFVGEKNRKTIRVREKIEKKRVEIEKSNIVGKLLI